MELTERKIQEIKDFYNGGATHGEVKSRFGINDAQEYAINVVGRDYGLSVGFLAEKLPDIQSDMLTDQICNVLGVSYPRKENL